MDYFSLILGLLIGFGIGFMWKYIAIAINAFQNERRGINPQNQGSQSQNMGDLLLK